MVPEPRPTVGSPGAMRRAAPSALLATWVAALVLAPAIGCNMLTGSDDLIVEDTATASGSGGTASSTTSMAAGSGSGLVGGASSGGAGGGGAVAIDPCDGIDCGPHGACADVGGEPSCACDSGYHAAGLTCEADEPPGPCDGITCGQNAACLDGGCECNDGYEGDPVSGCTALDPTEEQVRAELVQIAEAELGYCEGVDDRPYMLGQPGYWCYDFVAWVYDQSSYALPSPLSLDKYYVGSLPDWWRPEPGDLIKFTIQHYGMVRSVSADGQVITTVEGNFNSCVMTRSISDGSVEYYGTLDSVL